MDLKLVTKELSRTINRNSPSILTGLGIAGFATSIIMAAKATPKALEMIEEARHHEMRFNEQQGTEMVPFGPKETILLGGPYFVPTIGMALLSATAIIMANRINLRRNAALAGLYAIAESGLRDYQAKVLETVGKNKEEKIRGDVAQDKLNSHPLDEGQVVMTGDGKMLCYEMMSGRYFMSDIETLRQIQNEFNARLLVEMTLPLNELFYDMGLGNVELGKDVGWIVEKGLLDFMFFAKLATNNQPCIVVGYNNPPTQIQF